MKLIHSFTENIKIDEKKFDNESDTIRDLVNEFGIKPAQVKNSIKDLNFLKTSTCRKKLWCWKI